MGHGGLIGLCSASVQSGSARLSLGTLDEPTHLRSRYGRDGISLGNQIYLQVFNPLVLCAQGLTVLKLSIKNSIQNPKGGGTVPL